MFIHSSLYISKRLPHIFLLAGPTNDPIDHIADLASDSASVWDITFPFLSMIVVGCVCFVFEKCTILACNEFLTKFNVGDF